jgi:hypothetical protein
MLALVLAGCGTTSPRAPSRGKLSDAAERAKSPPEEQVRTKKKEKTVKHEPPPTYEEEEDEIIVIEPVLTGHAATAEEGGESVESDDVRVPATGDASPESERFYGSLEFGLGSQAGGIFDEIGAMGLHIGAYTKSRRLRGGLLAQVATFDLDPDRGLDDSLENLTELTIGGTGRYYFTPHHTFIGLYVTAGLHYGVLLYDFANPVEVEAGEEVDDDVVEVFAIHGGLGVSFVQWRWFRLSTTALGGVKAYEGVTSEGFDNDLFREAGFYKLTFEIGIVRPRSL